MKKGKTSKLNIFEDAKCYYGTVDAKNLKSIYIVLQTWIEPTDEDKNWNKIAKDFESFIQMHKGKKILIYITNHKYCAPCVWLSGPELYNFVTSAAYTGHKFPIFAIDALESFEDDFKKILSKYTTDQIIDGSTPQFVCVSINNSGKIKLEVKITPTQPLNNDSINKANLFGQWKEGMSLKNDPYIATSAQRKVFFEDMKKAFQ